MLAIILLIKKIRALQEGKMLENAALQSPIPHMRRTLDLAANIDSYCGYH